MTNKELQLRQRGLSVWLIGLSGAGKTTLANEIENQLFNIGVYSIVQDADVVRSGLNSGLGYTQTDRLENIRRASEVSKMLIHNAVVSINAFICPFHEMQQKVIQIIGRSNLVLVYLNTPLQICEQRDVKGLYQQARSGSLLHFTGISDVFEAPVEPNLQIDTSIIGIHESVQKIMNCIVPKIVIKKE